MRRFALALFALFPSLASAAEVPRTQLQSQNNAQIVAGKPGGILASDLNSLLGNMIDSAGMLKSSNLWEGANTFSALPAFSSCVGGVISPNGTSPATCPTIVQLLGYTPANVNGTNSWPQAQTFAFPSVYAFLSARPNASATTLNALVEQMVVGASYELVDDPSCAIDQRAKLQKWIDDAGARHGVLGPGTFCIKSGTLVASADNTWLDGHGEKTIIKWAATAGTAIAPAFDLRGANVRLTNMLVDHNASGTTYTDSTYFGTGPVRPIGDMAIVVQGNGDVVENLSVQNAFDNCIGLVKIDGALAEERGLPLYTKVNNIKTENCGSGVHSATGNGGGPGRIGAAVDTLSSSQGVISNIIDKGSYGSFIADVGAGAQGNVWSNLVSSGSKIDLRTTAAALYIGEANNSFHNVTILDAQALGLWNDFNAPGTNITNLNIKHPGKEAILLKGPINARNVTISDVGPTFNAITLDTAAGALTNVDVSGLKILTPDRTPLYSIGVVGTNNVTGRIDGFSFPGVNAETNIPGTVTGLRIHSLNANGEGFGSTSASFRYDFSGSFRVQASGAHAAYTSCVFGDGCDTTSARYEANTGSYTLGVGYDPVNAFFVLQHVQRDVAVRPLAVNPGGGTVTAGRLSGAATTDTAGFFGITCVAGPPTGVPADVPAGAVALRADCTNNRLYMYNGAWRHVQF